MFALGSYSGEVLRRAAGGEWHWGGLDDDKAASTDTELVLVDGSLVFPLQRIWKRLMNGEEESMTRWGARMSGGRGPLRRCRVGPSTPVTAPTSRRMGGAEPRGRRDTDGGRRRPRRTAGPTPTKP